MGPPQVQRLRLQAASAGGSMVPSWGTKISHAAAWTKKEYIYTHIYTHTHFKKPNFVIRQRVIIR